MTLQELVADFAEALRLADASGPIAKSQRGDRTFQPGIGPHAENAAIRLALDQLELMPRYRGASLGQFDPYPGAPRQKVDVWIGEPREWVIEVKMARFVGDNGRLDDMAVKDLLSPYSADHSAVTDCTKLANSAFDCGKAMLIYGFESELRPLEVVIAAFERLASVDVELGSRNQAPFAPLVHPHHSQGRLFGWEVRATP
jgi:hypothetical protein